MGGAPFTSDEQKTMLTLAVDGVRPPLIAKRIGRHHGSVVRWLRAHGFIFQRGPDPTDPKARFEKFLPSDRQLGCCWEFQGAIAKDSGYGQFALEGSRSIGAHVASYRLYKGLVPKGMLVRHTCDNKPCVNPEHLIAGTYQDNMDDCVKRRRTAKGERQHLARMTADKVLDLRRRYAEGERQDLLARRFGISQPTVSQIVRGVTWTHV